MVGGYGGDIVDGMLEWDEGRRFMGIVGNMLGGGGIEIGVDDGEGEFGEWK